MPLNSISGSTFKKMVMKATGTKGYLSSSVQGSMRKQQAGKFLNSGAKVTKQQATKVMKALKEEGLASKVTTNATQYTQHAFAREETRQENIKKLNVSERAKEISNEKMAEAAKANAGKQPAHKAVAGAGMHMAANAAAMSDSTPSHDEHLAMPGVAKTNLKPANELPTLPQRPTEWDKQDQNMIDLAID